MTPIKRFKAHLIKNISVSHLQRALAMGTKILLFLDMNAEFKAVYRLWRNIYRRKGMAENPAQGGICSAFVSMFP